jgi:hypothetical protein
MANSGLALQIDHGLRSIASKDLNDVAPASDKPTPTPPRMPASPVPLLTILRM